MVADQWTYSLLLCQRLTFFAGALWGSWGSFEVAIERFSTEMHALQEAALLPTSFTPVVRALKEHKSGFILIKMEVPSLLLCLLLMLFVGIL